MFAVLVTVGDAVPVDFVVIAVVVVVEEDTRDVNIGVSTATEPDNPIRE